MYGWSWALLFCKLDDHSQLKEEEAEEQYTNKQRTQRKTLGLRERSQRRRGREREIQYVYMYIYIYV